MSLIPYGQGEPFCHDDYCKFVNRIKDAGHDLKNVSTNLTYDLNEENLSTMMRFDEILINVSGATEDSHFINSKTSLKKWKQNLKQLYNYREQTGSDTVLWVKMVCNKHNYKEQELVKEMVHEIAPLEVVTSPVYFSSMDGTKEDRVKFFDDNLADDQGNLIDAIPTRELVRKRSDGDIEVVSKKKFECDEFLPDVKPHGGVYLCCRARWYGKSLGNAFEVPMKQIVESAAWLQAIELAKNRKYCEYCKYCS